MSIQEVDKEIAAIQEAIRLSESLERLSSNRDFKLLVTEGYLSKEALQLLYRKAEPVMQNPDAQKALTSQLDSIGHFHQYLARVKQDGETARRHLFEAEQTRETLLLEEQR